MKTRGVLSILVGLLLLGYPHVASAGPPSRAPVHTAPESGPPSDTELHLSAGVAAGLIGGGCCLYLRARDASSVTKSTALCAISVSAAAGIAKEVVDLLGFGRSEARDVLNTVIGGGLSVVAITGLLTTGGVSSANRATVSSGFVVIGLSLTAVVFRQVRPRGDAD